MVLSVDNSSLSTDSTISAAKCLSLRRLRLIFPWPFCFFNFIRRTFTTSVTPADDLSLSSDSSIPTGQINFTPNFPPFLKRNRGVLLGLFATGIGLFFGMMSNMSRYQPSNLSERISLDRLVPLTIVFQIQFLESQFFEVNPTLCYVLNDLMDFNIIENVTISLQNLSDNEVDNSGIQKGS